jgi:hypothetical protein
LARPSPCAVAETTQNRPKRPEVINKTLRKPFVHQGLAVRFADASVSERGKKGAKHRCTSGFAVVCEGHLKTATSIISFGFEPESQLPARRQPERFAESPARNASKPIRANTSAAAKMVLLHARPWQTWRIGWIFDDDREPFVGQ